MSDPDRLQQLRRQRAAIAEHLAWLDQEIKRASAGSLRTAGDKPSPPSQSVISPGTPTLKPTLPPRPPIQLEANNPSPALTADPDAVLEEWTETGGNSDQPVSKMGCWLIFSAIAVGVVGLIVAFIYVVYG